MKFIRQRNAFVTSYISFVVVLLILAVSPTGAGTTGEALYLQYCAACHQPNGKGIPGFFPPLAENPLVTTEDPEKIQKYLERIIFGYHGGLTVKGELYSGTMPPIGYFGRLNDSELLDLINYQRIAWGNKAKPVTTLDLARTQQARWKLLTGTKGLCTMHYDSKSISYFSDNRVRVWMRTSLHPECKIYSEGIKYLKTLGEDYKNYEYNSDLYEINCSTNTFELLETSHLTKDEKTIHSIKHTGYETDIPSGSVLKTLKDVVCKKK
ncbi:MAG: cytochrome c [Nitrospirota bacterium]